MRAPRPTLVIFSTANFGLFAYSFVSSRTFPNSTIESELFASAGYLSPQALTAADTIEESHARQLDPVVARVLAQEPIDVQRTVVAILTMLKSIARSLD